MAAFQPMMQEINKKYFSGTTPIYFSDSETHKDDPLNTSLSNFVGLGEVIQLNKEIDKIVKTSSLEL